MAEATYNEKESQKLYEDMLADVGASRLRFPGGLSHVELLWEPGSGQERGRCEGYRVQAKGEGSDV